MGRLKKHKDQALHNENFYNYIKDDNFTDWAATGLFYAALHYIEGYLESKNISVANHRQRINYINRVRDLKSLYYHYRILYDMSVNARYKFHKINKKDLSALYKNDYEPIKTHILSLC